MLRVGEDTTSGNGSDCTKLTFGPQAKPCLRFQISGCGLSERAYGTSLTLFGIAGKARARDGLGSLSAAG